MARNRVLGLQLCGLCLIMASTIIGSNLLGQNASGSIRGTVTAPNGVAVPGAEIVLLNKDTGAEFHATTNAEGQYVFPRLTSGHYRLRVSFAGFRAQEVDSITLSVSEAQTVDIAIGGGGRAGAPPPPPPKGWVAPEPEPSPSPAPTSYRFTDPVWNVWAERSSTPSFKPRNLQPGLEYTLVVDLAALAYRELEGTGVYSQDVSASIVDWIKRYADIDSADLELLAVPDQRYIQMRGERTQTLHIDLKKMRGTQQSGFTLDSTAFDYLRSNSGNGPFSFGRVLFGLRVLGNAPLGNAPVALSIWADGKPIDEMAVNLCVAAKPEDSCPTSSASSDYTLRGADLSGTGKYPDAALHAVERGSDVVAVFRCNSCAGSKYLSWTIGQQKDGWLADRVSEVVQHLTPPVPSAGEFAKQGDILYNLLFPNNSDPDETEAEKAFGAFFSSAHQKGPTDEPSSLFVRLLPSKPTLVLFPMALMRAPLPGGSREFVGFSVNIEAPLELQDYSSQSKCISDWVLFAPAAPAADDESLGDLAFARGYASDWIDLMTKSCPTCSYSDPDKFSEWLLGTTQPAPPKESQALVILSQYKNNSLYFNALADNPPSVSSGSIRRTFATPSFAILDACGTAAPGGSEFIRDLNEHGVYSVISTSAAIPGPMGGQFLKIFMELVAKHPEYTVSRARYEAVKSLSTRPASTGETFGAQALEFTLVGNGGLHVCGPGSGATVPKQ